MTWNGAKTVGAALFVACALCLVTGAAPRYDALLIGLVACICWSIGSARD